jgi:rsbT co-antagonist protein RsbR
MTEPPMTAFRAHLEMRRLDLAQQIAGALGDTGVLTIAAIADQLDLWFSYLHDPDAILPVIVQRLSGRAPDNPLTLARIAPSIAVYRQYVLDAALVAATAGVQGAFDGVKAVMRVIDLVLQKSIELDSVRETQQAQRIEQIINSTPLALIEFDTQGRITRWNPGAERIFGWTRDEAFGQHILRLVVPGVTDAQAEYGIELFASGIIPDRRNIAITKEGRTIICQWYNAAIKDSSGRVVSIVSQAEDVTVAFHRESLFRSIMDNSPSLIHAKDPQGRYILANPQFCQLFGVKQEDLLGKTDEQLLSPELAQEIRQHDQEIIAAGRLSEREVEAPSMSGGQTYLEIKFPFYDQDRQLLGTCSISTNITGTKHADQERAALREELIATQEQMLRELSTPLIPLSNGLVLMPLIGSIDSNRAQLAIEVLLQGVTDHHAQLVILDITGVPLVDTQIAATLLRAAQAVKLLGARVILTGIRPEIAQTLVGLGINLQDIDTRGSLQSGVAFAMGLQRRAQGKT